MAELESRLRQADKSVAKIMGSSEECFAAMLAKVERDDSELSRDDSMSSGLAAAVPAVPRASPQWKSVVAGADEPPSSKAKARKVERTVARSNPPRATRKQMLAKRASTAALTAKRNSAAPQAEQPPD